MIQELDIHLESLESMKKYPSKLFYLGNKELLNAKKISIVGSRKPNAYAREMTRVLVQRLTALGIKIVSGGAIGIDAVAHKAAGAKNTIMVAATGVDKRYPAINKNLIAEIEQQGLVLSQFELGSPSTKYNFVLRNELVVALGDVLIVSYADLNSGTMRSVEYAQKMGKKIYVLAHRIGESEATNRLLLEKKAEAIYDIDAFVALFADKEQTPPSQAPLSQFLLFCQANPTYEEGVSRFPKEIFEAELNGTIIVKDGKIYLA